MDARRVERALRDGPPDEPVYVPGTFGRRRRGRTWAVVTTVAVGLALVAGVVVGVGLAWLGGPHPGRQPQPTPVVLADLLGTWQTPVVTRQEWIDRVTAAGIDSATVSAFLDHDPIQRQVRYTLEFFTSDTSGDRVSVSAEYDGGPLVPVDAGGISLDANGVVQYTEIVPGTAGPRVTVSALVTITGGQLRFQILDIQNATADDQLANTVFFELAPYMKAGP
jgi:hypothetical protein